MAYRAETPTLRARLSLARPMLLRAGLLGLCAGLVVIGLMENVTRFGSPETLRSDGRVAPSDIQADAGSDPLRADRMQVATRSENSPIVTLQ